MEPEVDDDGSDVVVSGELTSFCSSTSMSMAPQPVLRCPWRDFRWRCSVTASGYVYVSSIGVRSVSSLASWRRCGEAVAFKAPM